MTLISIPLPMPMPVPAPAGPPSTSSGSTSNGAATSAPDAPVDDEEAEDPTKPKVKASDFNELLAAVVAATNPVAVPVVPEVVAPVPTEPVVPDVVAAMAQIPTTVAPVVPVAVPIVATEIPTRPTVVPELPVDVAPTTTEVAEVPTPTTTAVAAVAVAEVAPEITPAEPTIDEPVGPVDEDTAPDLVAPAVEPERHVEAPTPVAPEVIAAAVQERPAAPRAVVETGEPVADEPTSAVDPSSSVGPQTTAPLAPQSTRSVEAPAAPAPAPRVHTPIVTAVMPLVQRGDGSYHVSVRLHPAELGAVDVDVELRGGEINLRLRTESVAGRDAIRLALPMLRSELEAAGVQTGTFDLGDRPSGQTPDQQQPQAQLPTTPSTAGVPIDDQLVPSTDAATDAAVNVRV